MSVILLNRILLLKVSRLVKQAVVSTIDNVDEGETDNATMMERLQSLEQGYLAEEGRSDQMFPVSDFT